MGAQVGTAFVDALKKTGLFSEVKVYDTIPDILRDVNAGRLKAGFADYPILAYNLKQGNFAEVRLVDAYKPVTVGTVAIGIRKSDTELLAKIKTPKLTPFHPQQPKRIELPNGMILFLQEDHELPLIDGSIVIRGGSRTEPAAKVGLVSLFGQVWRTGGTRTRTGDQLDDFLEARAAKVETGGGLDSTSVGWSSLKNDFNDVFEVVLELLKEPEFRSEKILLAKQQVATGLSLELGDLGGEITADQLGAAPGDFPQRRRDDVLGHRVHAHAELSGALHGGPGGGEALVGLATQ